MYELTNYEEARKALALCASIDEAKDISDKSEALRAYAKMSKDTELEVYASTIKMRAQVKLGELIAAIPKAAPFHRSDAGTMTKTEALTEAGISKTTAHAYEQAAKVPESVIESYITESTEARKPVKLADIVKKEPKPKAPPEPRTIEIKPTPPRAETIEVDKDDYEEMKQEIDRFHADAVALESVLDADDALAAAVAEIRQLNAQLAALQTRFNGLQNEKNAAIKQVKSLQRQLAAHVIRTRGGLPI